jgi:hypothetical protein
MIWLMVVGAVGFYGVLLVALFVAMCQPPVRFGRIMRHFPEWGMSLVPFEPMWNVARGGALGVGDPAPDFSLRTVEGRGDVRLSSLRGRQPIVLVFGSYT